ncbi:MAG: GGDEF domain-containing protein, partial [Planctomycetes bacterium]|nr:GGDEF domain-containing protein [Planctomycetota bacterium]
PVLAETIESRGRVLGQISLAPRRDGPYTTADTAKLGHYAQLVGHLLESAQRHRRWRDLALTDELSGLPNRRHLLQFLDRILVQASQQQFCVTLLIFDIDNFKTYNDACGHGAGDEIIRLTGRLFRQHCREHDVVARHGGDEFAVVFWDAEQPRQADSKHPHDAFVVLERFTRDLGATELEALKDLPDAQLTISGGLATFPWDAHTTKDLITKADQALLQAKRAGKNRILTIGQPSADDTPQPQETTPLDSPHDNGT